MIQGGECTMGMGGAWEKGGEAWQGRRGEGDAHQTTQRRTGERMCLGGRRQGGAREGSRTHARERKMRRNRNTAKGIWGRKPHHGDGRRVKDEGEAWQGRWGESDTHRMTRRHAGERRQRERRRVDTRKRAKAKKKLRCCKRGSWGGNCACEVT